MKRLIEMGLNLLAIVLAEGHSLIFRGRRVL